MKRQTLILVTASFTLSACLATAQQKGADSPEMEYLRRLIAEQQKNPDKIIRVVPKTNAPTVVNTASTNRPATAPETAKTAPSKSATPVRARENTNAAPPNAEAAQQKKISEVETRLDEMIKQKEAREKAAVSAAPATNAASAAPLTKRQRLDALLKEMIDGKISGTEYNERRTKIIAEPD